MFGRKGLQKEPIVLRTLPEVSKAQGHQGGMEFAQVSGEFFFELLYQQMVASGDPSDPVGLENFIGLLASAGGVACIATALCELEVVKGHDTNPNLVLERQEGGQSYFAGDLPSRYLYESEASLLNIALQWAMKHGAQIEHDFLHEPVDHTMQSVGSSQFGVPRLPPEFTPNALPIDLALCAWPQADIAFEAAGLAMEWRPAALGFAIGKAIDLGASSLDPMVLAKIAVECSVPMAAVDPSQFLPRLDELRQHA